MSARSCLALSLAAMLAPAQAQNVPQPQATDRAAASGSDAGAAAAPAPTSVTDLDSVQVIGRAQRLYKADQAAVGTRTGTPLERVPQSVQVLPRELIDDQAARQVTDLYRSISGISYFSYAGVTLRGFRQENVLYDGLRGDPYSGFSVPQLFNIERIEVLKGPAGALYGGGDPGGVINYVSKKPKRESERSIELQAGNYGFRAASVELTGPLANNERIRYRVGAYADDENPFRRNTDAQSVIGDFGLAFDIGDTGELSLQYTDVTQNLGGNRLRGVPVDDNGRFLTSTRWNHNEPTDYLDMRAKVASARFSAKPSDSLDIDVSARWFENQEAQQYHEPMGLIDRDRDGVREWMTRQFRDQLRDNRAVAVNANLVKRFEFAGMPHQVLFGADAYRADSDFKGRTANSDTARGPVPGIDLFRPVYGLTSAASYRLERFAWSGTSTRGNRYGAYLQDEIGLSERWFLLAGLRWDGFKDENRLNGSSVDGDDLSWRLGATFAATRATNLYASLASGFLPQSTNNQNPNAGGPFDPERSRQWEIGAKSSLFDGRATLNAALYRIERRNILQADGRVVNGVSQLAPLGLVRSEGLEIDLLADLTSRWVLNVAYAYNDARVLEAGRNGIVNSSGGRFANAPRNKLGVWTRYDIPALRSALGFGLDYVDERVSLDGQRVKPYTVFDASWQTQWRDWKFQANLKNLFDKVYAASGFIERNGHFPGEPRRLYLQAQYSF
ncbi:TonB-dependent siderophore receptor [Lysobacter enzymogenes]|uniref:TonB-dependent siderophore receptor n=1 Tax=Lysobacter enzymogenes TaxID=69 RepID=UPI001F61EF22|nr:TonB-dependent receptor [Lysobacter enzymogenes]